MIEMRMEEVRRMATRIGAETDTIIIGGTRNRNNTIARIAFVNALFDHKDFPISYDTVGKVIKKDHSTIVYYMKSRSIFEDTQTYIDVYDKTRSFMIYSGVDENDKDDNIYEMIQKIKDLADKLRDSLH